MIATAGGNWDETLSQVERSIGDCLAALDRYERAFTKVLHEHPEAIAARPLPAPSPVWDEKLAAATRQADEVEGLLAEQEVVWGRWRQTFGTWQQMMQELPASFAGRRTT